MTDILRKPSEWAALDNIRILDPDGWRSPNEKDFETPISRDEWDERSLRSTIQPLGMRGGTVCSNCGREMTEPSPDPNACAECFTYRQYNEEREAEEEGELRQVTREMARDAGDLRLEGQWIRW